MKSEDPENYRAAVVGCALGLVALGGGIALMLCGLIWSGLASAIWGAGLFIMGWRLGETAINCEIEQAKGSMTLDPELETCPQTSFTCAYWEYLRGRTPRVPQPVDYGLTEMTAAVLRRQCHIEYKIHHPEGEAS